MGHKRGLLPTVLYRFTAINKNINQKLRLFWLSASGASIGKDNKVGRIFVSVPEQLTIGSKNLIEDFVRLRVGGPWGIAKIEIGNDSFIGHSTQINIGSSFKIGSHCMIAPLCVFTDANHGFEDINIPMKVQPCRYDSIEVKDDVWIGSGCVILGGVTIGQGAIVAAGAVVNKSIPDYEIWGGIPAKKIKSRKD